MLTLLDAMSCFIYIPPYLVLPVTTRNMNFPDPHSWLLCIAASNTDLQQCEMSTTRSSSRADKNCPNLLPVHKNITEVNIATTLISRALSNIGIITVLLFAANYLFIMPAMCVKFVHCGVCTLMINLDMTHLYVGTIGQSSCPVISVQSVSWAMICGLRRHLFPQFLLTSHD